MQFLKHFGARTEVVLDGMIDIAKSLGISTLAEGVETEEQAALLRRIGCEKLQGYFFNSPRPLDYIVERYHNSTGLTFENPMRQQYNDQIGRINLNDPFSSFVDEDGLDITKNLPAAILLLDEHGQYSCLRGNNEYLNLLVDTGRMSELQVVKMNDRMEHRFDLQPSPQLDRSARAAIRTGGWQMLNGSIDSNRRVTTYLHRIAQDPDTENWTILLILLRNVHQSEEDHESL